MKIAALTLLLVLFPFLLSAQKKQGRALLDSLLKELPKAADDSQKVFLLHDISFTYSTMDPGKGIEYGQQELELAEDLGFKKGIAKAYKALGNNFDSRSDYPTALSYYFKSLKIYEELGDQKEIGKAYGSIAAIYQASKQYQKALNYDLSALKIDEKLGLMYEQAVNLGSIGFDYQLLGKYGESLDYCFKAIRIFNDLGFKSEEGTCIETVSYVFQKQRNYTGSLEYGQRSYDMAKQLGDKLSMASSISNIGTCYLEMATDSAFINGKTGRGNKNKYLRSAIEYLTTSVNLFRELGNLDGMQEYSLHLSEAQSLLGNYKEAIRNYVEYAKAKDSVFSMQNNINVANLETKRAIELKERDKEIETLKRDKLRIIYISGIGLLLIIMAIVVRSFLKQIRSNRQLAKEKKKHLEHIDAQGTMLKDIAYIQSHEIRGPLATIMGLVSLFNYDEADAENVELMQGIASASARLDKIVTEVVEKENDLSGKQKS